MVVYNFKKITPVPNGKEFMDIVLSKTQRKTPTEIHPQYAINRIRRFYMRKVKFCQQAIHDRITLILDEFPRLGDIHPFYEDLMNVLYDKDHYKLALGQLSTCRNVVDAIGRDYVRLLKYGDSLYRCKQLKRAALGRMITVLTKQNSSLVYLEQVRQHLARLPSIDPSSRTLILVGYPNVGKSSFMNNMTRAQVDVQPYPFTTKSLFVGHMEYRYLKWQLIDTPGILDHPLEQRNTIEMQSITAMAHLRSTILYLCDVSETCGYNIKQQCDLFKNIKPLFAGKPVLLVLTKIDLVRYEDLSDEHKKMLQEIADMCSDMIGISNLNQSGLNDVKTRACDLLLQNRVEAKINHGKKSVESILNRVHLAQPKKRDDKIREPQIPDSVLRKRAGMDDESGDMEDEPRITEKHLENLGGGAGVYTPDYKKHYLLKNDEWKNDIIPEIMDGKNIADFVDPEIDKRLEELEREEDERLREEGGFEGGVNYADDEFYVDSEEEEDFQKIMDKKSVIIQTNRINKNTNHPKLTRKDKPIDLNSIVSELKDRGVPQEALDKARSSSVARTSSVGRGHKLATSSVGPRARSESKMAKNRSASEKRAAAEYESVDIDKTALSKKRSLTPHNPLTEKIGRFAGIKDAKKQVSAVKLGLKKIKTLQASGKRTEADHVIFNMKPKHLFSGKTTIGKKDYR
ncbi:hypothetical protein C9374_003715 [Naegleria lovaniensis]|uniref:Nucleolar GTP-binding protein 1 n=1 Tax=Naegleria lovaniensis TaxID=51637 RepID=A0AA88KS73_NAELO|nr:uncharacterized protein C9374_003715 [Naegleria lovaniensis]KAG2393951.1 hypothetical protein C9374_003715 [Naegleria lovaniensis]